MSRAVIEGVIYNLRQCAEICEGLGFSPETCMASGGASRSDDWMQIMADVLGIPILRMEGNPGAGYGMAMLAGYAIGEIPVERISPASKDAGNEPAGTVFRPDAARSALYNASYSRYLRIHDALKEIG